MVLSPSTLLVLAFLLTSGGATPKVPRVHGSVSAQDEAPRPLAEIPQHFARSVAVLPDIDGDGCSDFLVGSHGRPSPPSGVVHLFSGRTGELVRDFVSKHRVEEELEFASSFGIAVAAVDDADGDGLADCAVGVPGPIRGHEAGWVEVLSIATGSLLKTLAPQPDERFFGSELLSLDSVKDDASLSVLVVRASLHDAEGATYRVSGFSMPDGERLYQVNVDIGSRPRPEGASLASIGDIDADGFGDFAVLTGAGAVLLSGLDGSHIALLKREEKCDWGFAITGGLDHDGDGRSDILMGCPSSSEGCVPIRCYSGKTLEELSMTGAESHPRWTGGALCIVGDVDNDGTLDFASARRVPFGDGVYFHSGRTGEVLFRAAEPSNFPLLGARLLGGADFNGDGQPDVLATRYTPYARERNHGVWLCSGADGSTLHEVHASDF